MLFKGKEQIFRDVIHFAEARKKAYDLTKLENGRIFEKASEFKLSPAELETEVSLKNYMNSLAFEDIKMLQVVMYLGREHDHDKTLSTPLEIYNDYFKYIAGNGWHSKEREINQMKEKMPLADYLKSGLEILNIEL